MKIEITIKKEHFYFIVILIAVLFAVGVNASVYKNINNKVGHDANETGPGIFGGTATSWFIFPGNLRINNSLNVSGNITFENKAQITATQNLIINTPNLTITNNLTLGGISRDSWPSGGAATSRLPAENITAGTFGANVGNGSFGFPGNLTISGNLFLPLDVTGIFFRTNSRNVNKPHIDYNDANGLWISSGVGSNKPINIEGGNLTITQGNITFNNKAQITAPTNIYLNTLNVTIQGNLTLNGTSRDSWPADVKNLSARNITPGTFGENVGNGNYTFPENLNVTKNMAIGGNITFNNKAQITAPTNIYLNTLNVTIQGNLTLNGTSKDHWPVFKCEDRTGGSSQGGSNGNELCNQINASCVSGRNSAWAAIDCWDRCLAGCVPPIIARCCKVI